MTLLIILTAWVAFVALVLLFMAGANRDRSRLGPYDEFYGQD